jgi:hypothetical protein
MPARFAGLAILGEKKNKTPPPTTTVKQIKNCSHVSRLYVFWKKKTTNQSLITYRNNFVLWVPKYS